MRFPATAFLLVLAHAACSTTTAPESLVGTFVLETVNGLPLPYTVRETAALKEELTATLLNFAGDGKFTMEIWTRVTQSGFADSVVETKTGKWNESGTTVRLILDDQPLESVAFRMGDTLSMEDKKNGEELVFRRQ